MPDEKDIDAREVAAEERELLDRRDFLLGLQKWSAAVIGAVIGGVVVAEEAQAGSAAWVNRRGGSVNGGGWVNRGGGWINGGGAWVNASGGGGGAWVNGHGGWVNGRGGWINGGGAWVNR